MSGFIQRRNDMDRDFEGRMQKKLDELKASKKPEPIRSFQQGTFSR